MLAYGPPGWRCRRESCHPKAVREGASKMHSQRSHPRSQGIGGRSRTL
jgi:hypothetical protein